MSLEKEQLRKPLWSKRLDMSADERTAKSEAVAERLIKEINWKLIRSLHIYSSVEEWNEIDTRPILRYLNENWFGIEVVRPSTNPGPIVAEQAFDLIIVPCLGFDKDCYRIGLGGGYYDRFLASQPQAMKIGLCFESGLVKAGIPHEPHDIALDKIITEEVIIEAHDSEGGKNS